MIADLYLAVLLLVMAAGQTASFPRFVDALDTYGITTPLVTITAIGFIVATSPFDGDVIAVVVHSDHGRRFRSRAFTATLEANALTGSMGRLG